MGASSPFFLRVPVRESESVWLRIPSTCCPSAPVSEGLSSDSEWLFPLLESSVTWRTKHMPARFWRRALKKRSWMMRLFGRILNPSKARLGVEWWISSLRDSRVSHTRLLENDSEKKTSVISGPRSSGSSRSASQVSYSSKTFTSPLFESRLLTFTQWASLCRHPMRPLPPRWVQDILDEESSFLPTATQDYGTNRGGAAGRVGKVRPNLKKYLATPLATDRDGRMDNTTTRLTKQLGGQVNPNWKDWYMGFPIGWTSIEPLETQSFLSWLQRHLSILHGERGLNEKEKA